MDGFKRPNRDVYGAPSGDRSMSDGPMLPRPQAPMQQLRPNPQHVQQQPMPQPYQTDYRRSSPQGHLPTQQPMSPTPQYRQAMMESNQTMSAGQPDSATVSDSTIQSLDLGPALGEQQAPQKKMRKTPVIIAVLLGVIILAGAGAYLWYTQALQPAGSDDEETVSLEIEPGWSWPNVAKVLADKKAIRSEFAFTVYARLEGVALQQATCLVRPSDSSQEIVSMLASGCKSDAYKAVMFYPGATIEKPLYKPDHAQLSQTMYVKHVLSKAGYSDEEIETALAKTYEGPLFAGKPASANLEGYIYGDTYHVDENASAEDVLKTAFAHMYSDIKKNNIEANFKARGLDLFKGITLASIVQRELNCEDKPTPERKDRCHQYQRTIAQVFHKRLKEGIPLGADVTFIYAADMMKVEPSVDLESEYNTRKYAGLPPGPIGTPGLLALKAVAEPTDTDYLFFVAGDDGLIYFGKTMQEHEANIQKYCDRACQL